MTITEIIRANDLLRRVEEAGFKIEPDRGDYSDNKVCVTHKLSEKYADGAALIRTKTFEEAIAFCKGYIARMDYEGINGMKESKERKDKK